MYMYLNYCTVKFNMIPEEFKSMTSSEISGAVFKIEQLLQVKSIL